jgi:flavin-dependent dehydrogenase
MRIIVIGGGPAGCRAAKRLKVQGHEALLVDAQGPREKPSGGGLTAKALALTKALDSHVPCAPVERIAIHFGDGDPVDFAPDEKLAVVARKELGQHLIEQAVRDGVRFVKDRVIRIERRSGRWLVTTRGQVLERDFLVGADGAASFVRRTLGAPFSSEDLNVTLGYFVPSPPSPEMRIYFVPGLEGYI